MTKTLVPVLAAALSGAMVCGACSAALPGEAAPAPVTVTATVTATASTAPTTEPPVTPAASETTAMTAASNEWVETVEEVRDGVVDIEVSTCEAELVTGTGFLVDHALIATAAHVVDDASGISIRTESGVATAQVIGLDRGLDLALLEASRALPGHIFELSQEEPSIGEELAVLGFPHRTVLGEGLSFTAGRVSATNRVPPGGTWDFGALQTDAAINPGNSGGPAILHDGTVAGVVSAILTQSEGLGFAVPAHVAGPSLASWGADRTPIAYSCADADPEEGEDVSTEIPVVTVSSDHRDATALGQTLALHGWNINNSHYQSAWETFTERQQTQLGDLETWQSGLLTTLWWELDVLDIEEEGDDRFATVSLQTTQSASDGFEGQECSEFLLRYALVPSAGDGWLIDDAELPQGPPTDCGAG